MQFIPRTAFACLTWFTVVAAIAGGVAPSSGAESVCLRLEVVRRADGHVLWAHPVQAGEKFTIDYRHSSDHTPVLDIFQIAADGTLVLIEERFDWYGSGLEFHPSADISFSGAQTRVRLHRPFAEIPLRVGEVAGHGLTLQGMRLPLLSIAKGRESICIRIARQPAESR